MTAEVELFPPVIEPEETLEDGEASAGPSVPAMMDALNTLAGVTMREMLAAPTELPPEEMDLAYSSALSALNFVTNIVVGLRAQRAAADAPKYDLLQVMTDNEMGCAWCSTGQRITDFPNKWNVVLATNGDYYIRCNSCKAKHRKKSA